MAYLPTVDDDFVRDIITRKEFLINQPAEHAYTQLDKEISDHGNLILRSFQHFAENYMSPEMPTRRIFVKYGTGVGKTILALNIATSFINLYSRIRIVYPDEQLPSIIVLGFTKTIFVQELLKYPEFGYITREELHHIAQLQYNRRFGADANDKRYTEFMSMIKRRLTRTQYRGFFQFYGYRKFVSRVFKTDISAMNEQDIINGIKNDTVKLNTEYLDTLKHSVIICDEVHNVYNSVDKNNWGVAIQAVLDYHKRDIRAIFLSATPLNYSPTEVIDLLNLIHEDKKFKREDLFSARDMTPDYEKIGKAFIGRVLFLEDNNPKYYPTSTIDGEPLPNTPILKFIRCPMSSFHYETYKHMYSGTLPHDERYIMDFALPNTDTYGLYKTQEIKYVLSTADKQWLDKNEINIIETEHGMVITGAFMRDPKYSTKYTKMANDVVNSIKHKKGKILIFHEHVHMSGVLYIREMLMQFGIINDGSEPNDTTLDVITGLTRAEHIKQKITSQFVPARMCVIHGEIDSTLRDRTFERFNAPDNARGNDILIMIGAKIIRESYNIKCIRELYVMSRPDDISTLIQIFGRAKRQHSHKDLPPDEHTINYRIYVSSLPKSESTLTYKDASGATHKTHFTYDEEKYQESIRQYITIQHIERAIHTYAVDAGNNIDIIKNTFAEKNGLGILPFTPVYTVKGANLNTATYDAWYSEREIELCMYIIKRLFIEVSPIFTLPDLIKFAREPQFHIEYNTRIIDEDSVKIALMRLVSRHDDKYISIMPKTNNDSIDSLLSSSDKVILYNNARYIITVIDIYYIMFPYSDNNQLEARFEMPYRIVQHRENTSINIGNYLLDAELNNAFDKRREQYIARYIDKPISDYKFAICDYSHTFHMLFIEEIIKEIFNIITTGKTTLKMNIIEFYVKMLYYYDMMSRNIIFYDEAKEFVRKTYSFKSISEADSDVAPYETIFEGLRPASWCPQKSIIDWGTRTSKLLNYITKRLKSKDYNPENVQGALLPIGTFIHVVPRFYNPARGWYDAPDYTKEVRVWKENDIIIGYFVRSKTGMSVRLKLRPPIDSNITDARKIEKGATCNTHSKEQLITILNKLGVKPPRGDVNTLCGEITSRIIYMELEERRKKTDIKYFYMYWEKQPFE